MNERELFKIFANELSGYVKQLLENARFDKTFACRILEQIDNTYYTIEKNGIKHTVSSKHEHKINDIVYVLLPCGDWKQAMIIY